MPAATLTTTEIEADHYRQARVRHWNAVSARPRGGGRAYHRRLEHVYRFLVAPGQRVLEVGSAAGDLLAAVQPATGVGVDFSEVALARGRERHPGLTLIDADAHDLSSLAGPFDVIILSDLLNDLWDVQGALTGLRRLCHPGTRVIANFYSRLWELPLRAAGAAGLATPLLKQNWLTPNDVVNLMHLSGFRVFRRWQEVLCPLPLPGIAPMCDRVLVRLPGGRILALANFVLARPIDEPETARGNPTVSVVVPARNEAGNVDAILARIPQMGGGTEIVFVEGHSSDGTWAAIQREVAASTAHPGRRLKAFQQTGKGKGDAVRLGFEKATGDVLMILDADLTMPPEELPSFYDVIAGGQADYVQGTRLVYPMEPGAMRFFNKLGNVAFSQLFTYLLQQPIKDTLCGTKVLWRKDYERIAAARSYFGDFDPFGDFDLIFGAARLNLKIVEIPVRYRDRTYGTTNIDRWKHGVLLLRMSAIAARKIKFV